MKSPALVFRAVFATAITVAASLALATDEAWIADANGCKVFDSHPVPGETITWSGQCKEGYADGPGILRWSVPNKPDSSSEGTFRAGKLNGRAVMKYSNGDRYDGTVVDSKPGGEGVLVLKSGVRIEGNFEKDRLNGKATLHYPDGSTFEGDYVAGKRTGHGIAIQASGLRYEGEFDDGAWTGQGTLTWPDKRQYEGQVVKGLPNGKGVMAYINGDRYEGEFTNGSLMGHGVLTHADGTVEKGQWLNGVYQTAPQVLAWGKDLQERFAAVNSAKTPTSDIGTGSLEATFDGSGIITGWTIKQSSGSAAVDARELDSIKSVSGLAPFPAKLKSFELVFHQTGDPASWPVYALKERQTGSSIPRAIVSNLHVPPDKPYGEMTEEQKTIIKLDHDPMLPTDEPPFPLYGEREMYEAVSLVNRRYSPHGLLRMTVLVGANGQPMTTKIYSSPDPDVASAMATILMTQKYKAAICDGKPCARSFPFVMDFGASGPGMQNIGTIAN